MMNLEEHTPPLATLGWSEPNFPKPASVGQLFVKHLFPDYEQIILSFGMLHGDWDVVETDVLDEGWDRIALTQSALEYVLPIKEGSSC